MRKIIQVIAVLSMLVLMAGTAFAEDKETIEEGADLSTVHRLAIAYPWYFPTGAENEPTLEDVLRLADDAAEAKSPKNYELLTYTNIVDFIRADYNLDIRALKRQKAEAQFKKYIDQYADAYVLVTVANNSRTCFFFEVYRVGTGDLLYVFEHTIGRMEHDDIPTYQKCYEQFFRQFDMAIENQQKQFAKQARDEEKQRQKEEQKAMRLDLQEMKVKPAQ